MLLKSKKKSPLRLLAGAISVAAFTAISLAATASYGFADKAVEHEAGKHKSSSRMIISVDKGEKLEVPGHPGATMIDVETTDGVRTVKVFGKNKKLLSEDIYEPGEKMPFEEIVTVSKEGERRTINLAKPAHRVPPVPPVAGVPPVPGEQRFIMIERDGDQEMHMAHCGDGEGHEPVVMEWSTEESDMEGHADGKVASYEVICMTDDEDADPATRVERLRSSIARMEDSAKRDAERRQEMIARLREELKEAEKNN